jgi:hypothetical protein
MVALLLVGQPVGHSAPVHSYDAAQLFYVYPLHALVQLLLQLSPQLLYVTHYSELGLICDHPHI